MTAKCPYCGTELAHNPLLPQMSERRLKVYRAVAAGGHDGISKGDLATAIFGNDPPPQSIHIMLRVLVHGINRILRDFNGQKIVSNRRGGYYLISVLE